jgi:hypothetical protein
MVDTFEVYSTSASLGIKFRAIRLTKTCRQIRVNNDAPVVVNNTVLQQGSLGRGFRTQQRQDDRYFK